MLKTPPLQTATATIDNYCSRLQSATLLEDRRAAIEGLRSVAKQYPASVAGGSLRELISTLRRDGLGEAGPDKKNGDSRQGEDGGDVDTIRLVLETLLRLFEPDPDSPEAGDEIALFLADEFCVRQDNVSLLLNLLDPTAPYSDNLSCKLSVQLLSAICAARPERLQESILKAPLGVSRLVGVLDSSRDDVRYAGLELLTNLTGGANEDLRKIVAFEDVFGKVFALIRMEGGLAEAGIVAQDCLTLLVNLIRGSSSNQTMFRESGCITQLTQLLRQIFPPPSPEATFVANNRERAGWGVIQFLRQLLVSGEPSTSQNQAALFRADTAQILLDLGFHPALPLIVRVAAFQTVADLIRSNAPIQVNFASLQVVLPSAANEQPPKHIKQPNGSRSNAASARNSARPSIEKQRTYVIEALLDLALHQPRTQYELRVAGGAVIQAYLVGHNEIRAHFLQRAIAGHKEGEVAPNVLTALLKPKEDNTSVVLAGWIVQDLVADQREAKAALAAVKEGDENEGEDVLTAVQALASELQQAIQQSIDETLIAIYASTLAVFLWDFADGINDLLSEGSSILQSLVEAAKSPSAVTAGLASALLGIVYEFSTKDSPIPRKSLSPLLVQKLGRNKYLNALSTFRSDPSIRDFDLPKSPEVQELSETFFDLFLNEYPRLRRAIDKDPGIEVLPYAAAEAGVQRDILDELRGRIQTLEESLSQSQQDAAQSSQQAQQDKLQSEQEKASWQKQAEQEKLALQKEAKSASEEAERIRNVIGKMQSNHEQELQSSQQRGRKEVEDVNIKHSRELATVRQEADRRAQQAKQSAEQGFVPVKQDYERKLAELGNAHRKEQAGHSDVRSRLDSLTQKHAETEGKAQESSGQLQDLSRRHGELEHAHQQLQDRSNKTDGDLAAARKNVEDIETQLETLRTQISELKEEVKGKDAELATERSGFADLEKELEAAKKASTTGSGKESGSSKKADKLKQLSDTLAEEVKKLKTEAESWKKKEAQITKDLDEEKSSAENAKEAEKGAKEELESLLLVLGEIEGKRDEYKAKVKELGGEITEDEDDEEDEEEANDDVD